MADPIKEEFPPLLRAGFHGMTIAELERLCVERFPDSVTRPSIMAHLIQVIAMIQREGMRGEVWINGSFVTEKLNPDDSDIILVVSREEFLKMDPKQLSFFSWFRDTSLKPTHRCDNYAFIKDETDIGQYTYAYWLRQFGFSRSNEMKGLIVIKVPFLVTV